MAYSGGYAGGYSDAVGAEVTFAGTGTFTADGVVEFSAAVAFAGTGTFTLAVATGDPEAAFIGAGTFTATAAVTFGATVRFPGGSSFMVAATAGAAVHFRGAGHLRVSVELDYRVDVVDHNGSVLGTLANARLGRYSFELNGTGTADFTLATTDPDAHLVRPGREIQIWRNGVLQWWGPVVRPQAGLDTSNWQCADLFWYFERRFMGRADRTNLLVNGDFEAGEANWTFEGGVTHSIDTALKVEGTQSLLLGGTAENHTGYASQTMPAWTQYHPDGDFLTASVWVYVPSSTYQGGAAGDLGLVVIHKRGAATVNAEFAVIDDDTPKNEWLPLEVGVGGVLTGDTVEVRLFPPHGTAYFDLATLTAMESLSFWPSADVADVVDGIVRYAQDRAPFNFNHGKSDVNVGTSTPATGTQVGRTYQFAEHRNVADAILEFVRMGIIDVDIEITPSIRTFTTYAPTKGTAFPVPLTLDQNVADFTWNWDGESAASSVIILGPGDGPDRPEGGATGALVGGEFSAELVESAPDDATIGELDTVAAERLAITVNPEILEVATLPGVGIIGNLHTGDTVPVRIQHGWLNINDTYRVVRIEVDPYVDQAHVTLNPVP